MLREPDVAIEAPAIPASVPLVRDLVVHVCRSLGVAPPILDDVALAVTEAASNTARHAYPAFGRPGIIRVTVRVREDEVALVVEDDGQGVTSLASAEGPGLGLGIIGAVADAADVGPTDEGRGTSVRMAFAR